MELEELYINTNKVDLYLNGQPVEFDNPPDILFNYSVTDYNSPTSVKNSYTKQISIPGTDNNNNIFNHIYNLERIQGYTAMYSGSEFNPIRTTDFVLYVNGEVYESGYFKLNEVTVTKSVIKYNITLFGGLGSFFWCLSHNVGVDGDSDNPEEKKMSDLIFQYEKDNGEDLGFTINKETLYEAWSDAGTSHWNKWGTINFAPCYNGVPESMESDKILVPKDEFNDGQFVFGEHPYDLVTAPRELTEWDTHDLRSYLQRPVVRVRSVIEACCDPENNGGYTVDLDPHFFNSENPYYEDTYCTLKTIPEMEIKDGEETPITISDVTIGSRDAETKVYPFSIKDSGDYTMYSNLRLSMNVILGGNLARTCSYPTLYTTTDFSNKGYSIVKTDTKNFNYRSSVCVQLLGYDAMGRVIGESKVWELHSRIDDDYTFTNNVVYGSFKKMLDGRYIFVDENGNNATLSFELNQDNDYYSFGIKVTRPFTVKGKWRYKGGVTFNWPRWKYCMEEDNASFLYSVQSTTVNGTYNWGQAASMNALDFRNPKNGSSFYDAMQYSLESARYCIPAVYAISGVRKESTTFLSNSYVSKEKLLDMDCTPADFFISYCKLFGLYIWKESDTKTIHVMDRNTFYTQEIINLDKYIDRDKQMTITPQLAESRWYDFKLEQAESAAQSEYMDNYHQEYGNKRVNTNFNFNSDVKDMFENNVFKGGIDVLEKNVYFKQAIGGNYSPALQNNATYSSFDADMKATEHNSPFLYGVQGDYLNDEFNGYDLFPKVQFHTSNNEATDGSMVLLLYSGDKAISNLDGYFITDDLNVMTLYGENPCWLATKGNHGIRIDFIPMFGRNIIFPQRNSHNITHSMDFGNPMITFMPEVYGTDGMGIYDRFWKDYVGDMYSVDNRMLKCSVLIRQKPHPEWLRNFYWFNNAIWRLNKISDWNVSSFDTTSCEFVKVLDTKDYTLRKTVTGTDLKLVIKDMTPIESYYSSNGRIYTEVYEFDSEEHDVVMTAKVQDGYPVRTMVPTDEDWTSTDPQWVSEGSTRPGDTALHIDQNNSSEDRECRYGINADEVNAAWIVIRQKADTRKIKADGPIDNDEGETVDKAVSDATEGRYYFEVYTVASGWDVSYADDWVTTNYKGRDELWINIDANTQRTDRSTTITFIADGEEYNVTLTQMGSNI